VIIIFILKNYLNENKKIMTKEEDKCYICLEKVKEPIYPAGCTHALCGKHLKVN